MKKFILLLLLSFVVLFLSGCMEHIDLPLFIFSSSTPLPQSPESEDEVLYGTEMFTTYSEILPIIDEGVEVFNNNLVLYRNIVSQCLFEEEEKSPNTFPLTRIDSTPSFYIEWPQEYKERYKTILEKIVNSVLPNGYGGTYKPIITDNEDAATFIISFVSSDTLMGELLFSSGVYGFYIIREKEENVIKRGTIYVRDYDFLKNTHPSFTPNQIWTIVEAILSEEMAQAPIVCQDTSIDSSMRFYDSPKISDYLKNPDLTQKDFEVVKIALKLPPGLNKGEWIRFIDKYMDIRR